MEVGPFIHLQMAMHVRRLEEGKSLRALGRWIGISFSSLARIEQGKGKPNLKTHIALLDWLGWDATKEKAQAAHVERTGLAALEARIAAVELSVEALTQRRARSRTPPQRRDDD